MDLVIDRIITFNPETRDTITRGILDQLEILPHEIPEYANIVLHLTPLINQVLITPTQERNVTEQEHAEATLNQVIYTLIGESPLVL